MRLLNATTQPLQFEVFYGDPPPYAILSHTWGIEDEEATFLDLRDGTGIDKIGFRKIIDCCDQAVRDNLGYVWIDTCCIDKTDSVELQEAINSMFIWYKKSVVCYAYLSDYGGRDGSVLDIEEFKASKWFTRGWTLQELIAPAKVLFYCQNWNFIGDRTELGNIISTITRINRDVLAGQNLELSSVAQRMAWASMRKTTRSEDMAYCLLGIFGVHMPLIYGEGGVEAFIRLQKEIIERSDDQSLFAWKQDHGVLGHGILATSPALFAESSSIIRNNNASSKKAYKMTNRGLEIQLHLTCTLHGGDLIALLGCGEVEDNNSSGHVLTNSFETVQTNYLPL
ncbi:HET-domain-containing protein [Stipitochalara longipes BDJ]|nr:HET-domain-containing protein [Stipitochalara longipes BDJ]